jgi:hypothetical protein
MVVVGGGGVPSRSSYYQYLLICHHQVKVMVKNRKNYRIRVEQTKR